MYDNILTINQLMHSIIRKIISLFQHLKRLNLIIKSNQKQVLGRKRFIQQRAFRRKYENISH